RRTGGSRMKSRGLALALAIAMSAALALARQQAWVSPTASLTGEWILTIVIFGNERSERLSLKSEKGKVAGTVHRRGKDVAFPVTTEGDAVEFVIPGPDGSKQAYSGKIAGGVLSGKLVETGANEWGESPAPDWRARRATPDSDRPVSPRTLDFEPVEF